MLGREIPYVPSHLTPTNSSQTFWKTLVSFPNLEEYGKNSAITGGVQISTPTHSLLDSLDLPRDCNENPIFFILILKVITNFSGGRGKRTYFETL